MNRALLIPLFSLGIAISALSAVSCRKAKPAEQATAETAPQSAEGDAPAGTDAPADVTPSSGNTSPRPAEEPGVLPEPGAMESVVAAEDRVRFEAWFRKYGLDPANPDTLAGDLDNDGSSNGSEFLADTDPTNPDSRPGVHKTIVMKEYHEVPLPVVLTSVDGETASIRRLDDPTAPAEKVKKGQPIRGLPFKVDRVQTRREFDKDGNPFDATSMELSNVSTQERVVLMKDLPARTSASYAVLTSADGEKTYQVREGDIFTGPDGETNYKLLDLRESEVVVQEMETQKIWTVSKRRKP